MHSIEWKIHFVKPKASLKPKNINNICDLHEQGLLTEAAVDWEGVAWLCGLGGARGKADCAPRGLIPLPVKIGWGGPPAHKIAS